MGTPWNAFLTHKGSRSLVRTVERRRPIYAGATASMCALIAPTCTWMLARRGHS